MKKFMLLAVLGSLLVASAGCQGTRRYFSRFGRGDECVECQSPCSACPCDPCVPMTGCGTCGEGAVLGGPVMPGPMMMDGGMVVPSEGAMVPLETVSPGPATRSGS